MQDPHQPHTSTPEELQTLSRMRRSGRPFLTWRDRNRSLQFMPLGAERSGVLISRQDPAGITLDWDRKTSAPHAQLSPLGSGWFLEDLNSSNGTYVGGSRVWGRTRLRDQMRITLGETILVFHHPPTARAENADGTTIFRTELSDNAIQRADLRDNELAVLIELCRPLICDAEDEPSTNPAIADALGFEENTVRKILTALFKRFDITEDPKRRRLARRAAVSVVTLDDYR